jgi:hypothetical protein
MKAKPVFCCSRSTSPGKVCEEPCEFSQPLFSIRSLVKSKPLTSDITKLESGKYSIRIYRGEKVLIRDNTPKTKERAKKAVKKYLELLRKAAPC